MSAHFDFQRLFYPQSIAVVGASRTPQTVGNDLIKNLVTQGYQGRVYPVNPKADELYGLRVYHQLSEVPEQIDLAVIAVPAAAVPTALAAAGDQGAKAAIIISAGFKEIGNHELEEEVVRICEERGIVMIGPNCLGVINPEIGMNASFAGLMPRLGGVAFMSQSGALCSSILDYAVDFHLGFSKFLSIGNKAVIDEIQLLEYLADDPQTRVIAMYAEQLENAPGFIEVARRLSRRATPKPIIILKSGRTEAGASAIASHTGSVAGGDAAYQALFDQAGVIRANTVRELFEFIDIFADNPIQPIEKLAIVTNAGGPGVITTDEVIRSGLQLAQLSDSTKHQLTAFLPPAASVHNPVDVLGDAKADRYRQALEVVAADPDVDGLIVVLTPQTTTEVAATAQAIIQLRRHLSKPLIACFMGKLSVDQAVTMMAQAGVSTTTFPELAVRALAAMSQMMRQAATNYSPTLPSTISSDQRDSLDKMIQNAISKNMGTDTGTGITNTATKGLSALSEDEALQLVESYGLSTLHRQLILTSDQAEQVSREFRSPVALKIVSPDILHKSDVGGVMLDIPPSELAAAYDQLLSSVHQRVPAAKLHGALAVEMAPREGLELLLGAQRVPGLGSMIVVGLGGIYVEVFKDVLGAFAPFSDDYARALLTRLRSYPLLRGVRGHQGYDLEAVVEAMGQLAEVMNNHPQISEIDLNPLLVLPAGQGTKVLDARVIVK